MIQQQESLRIIEWKDLDKFKFLVLSPTLFFCVRLCLYPTNVIKTRLQVQTRKQLYRGVLDALYKIPQQEGLRGLYKGFFVSSFGMISGQVYIVTYELMRSQMSHLAPARKGFVAGGTASILAQSITVPVDILSQYKMVQGAGGELGNQDAVRMFKGRTQPLSSFEIAKLIFKEHGPMGFYRGYFVSLLTFAPSSAIWWSTYSTLLPLLHPALHYDLPLFLLQSCSAVAAALTASTITNPIDVIRTRLQVGSRRSFLRESRHLLETEGVMGFGKGLSARLTFSIPFSVLIIVVYEFVKKMSLKKDSVPKYDSVS